MFTIPESREPTRPGEMLLHEFLEPLGMSQREAAKRLGIPVQRLNEIITGKRGMSINTALRVSRVFGMSPQFWIGLEAGHQTWCELRRDPGLRRLRPFVAKTRERPVMVRSKVAASKVAATKTRLKAASPNGRERTTPKR